MDVPYFTPIPLCMPLEASRYLKHFSLRSCSALFPKESRFYNKVASTSFRDWWIHVNWFPDTKLRMLLTFPWSMLSRRYSKRFRRDSDIFLADIWWRFIIDILCTLFFIQFRCSDRTFEVELFMDESKLAACGLIRFCCAFSKPVQVTPRRISVNPNTCRWILLYRLDIGRCRYRYGRDIFRWRLASPQVSYNYPPRVFLRNENLPNLIEFHFILCYMD